MKTFFFLDVDGVLNDDRTDSRNDSDKEFCNEVNSSAPHLWISRRAVARLNQIVRAIGDDLEVVLSSSWRFLGVDKVNAFLQRVGYSGPTIIQGTPRCWKSFTRGHEITLFLQQSLVKPGTARIVVVDDDTQAKPHADALFINTDGRFGLTDKDVSKVLAALAPPTPPIQLPEKL